MDATTLRQGPRTPVELATPAAAEGPGPLDDVRMRPARPGEGRIAAVALAAALPVLLTACGGGGDPDTEASPQGVDDGLGLQPNGLVMVAGIPAAVDEPEPARQPTTRRDAARLLMQATFGAARTEDVDAVQAEGVAHWLWRQFRLPFALHTSYLDTERKRNEHNKATDDMSYEAVWRQWLYEEGQLRARVAFALSEIFVISNVAPDLKPYAMSSYMDLLNRHAFGNWRELLKAVTLHPAMGYYLNLLRSKKEDVKTGTHPNENYAREVLQLFSIGLFKLDLRGAPVLGSDRKPVPTYDESVVKGFARAFSGWSFGGQGNADPKLFYKADFNLDANWTTPMLPFEAHHEPGTKQLLDGRVLPEGQGAAKDLEDALDCIFQHPNVGPFVCRQLIQRLVTSNPRGEYIERVARVFNDNGRGVRGDLRAVVQAILTDVDARGEVEAARTGFGKQREPVIRFAHLLRALRASSPSPVGRSCLHYMDQDGEQMGQSPLLAPSVFNFFSPNYRHPGVLAAAGLVAPEFQVTTESTVVGVYNAFWRVIMWGQHGWDEGKLTMDFEPWIALLRQGPQALVDRIDLLLFNQKMSAGTRARLITLATRQWNQEWELKPCVKRTLLVAAVSPDFVIQK